jgi:hypothetical protein
LLPRTGCCRLQGHNSAATALPACLPALQYRSATKIVDKFDCNLLVATSRHIILCQERRLQLYNLAGVKEREWLMDSTIRWGGGLKAAGAEAAARPAAGLLLAAAGLLAAGLLAAGLLAAGLLAAVVLLALARLPEHPRAAPGPAGTSRWRAAPRGARGCWWASRAAP